MSYSFEKPKKKKEVSSGWRGIGCVLMILLPAVSYFAAEYMLLHTAPVRNIFLKATPALFGTVSIPPVLLRMTTLNPLWVWLRGQNNLMVELLFGAIILIALSGLVAMIYGFMYRAVAPSKYGPMDAPPPKRRGKRKKYSR